MGMTLLLLLLQLEFGNQILSRIEHATGLDTAYEASGALLELLQSTSFTEIVFASGKEMIKLVKGCYTRNKIHSLTLLQSDP